MGECKGGVRGVEGGYIGGYMGYMRGGTRRPRRSPGLLGRSGCLHNTKARKPLSAPCELQVVEDISLSEWRRADVRPQNFRES